MQEDVSTLDENDAGLTVADERSRKIIHVDMDAFFASVEQRDDPALRGSPVAVGVSRERGMVAVASYETRVFCVRSAMPSVTARRKCPDLDFVKPRFEVYKAVSQQIRAIFAEHTTAIEPLSLDEAYLDVTEKLMGLPLAERCEYALGHGRPAHVLHADLLDQARQGADAREQDGGRVLGRVHTAGRLPIRRSDRTRRT